MEYSAEDTFNIMSATIRNSQRSIDEIRKDIKDIRRAECDKDSIEIGTPAKGGAIKAYGDFLNSEEFKKRIDAAVELRAYAQGKIFSPGNPGESKE